MNKNKYTIKTIYLIGFSLCVYSISHAMAQDLCNITFTQHKTTKPSVEPPTELTKELTTKLTTQNNNDVVTNQPLTILTKNQILSKKLIVLLQNNIEDYQYNKGYIYIADTYFNGSLLKTYRFVASILEPAQFKQLKWQKIHGSTQKFYNVQKEFVDENGEVKKEFIGIEGYIAFADKFFDGYMIKTFTNISAIFGVKKIQEAGWSIFNGTTQDVYQIRNGILDKNGNVIKDYIGMQGFALFAEFYFNKNMSKTFRNVNVAIGKNNFQNLRWQYFMGATQDFDTIYSLVVDKNDQIRKEVIGPDGLIYIAKEYFGNSVHTAFQNISAVLGNTMFNKLRWKTFNGHVKDYQAVKNLINSFNSTHSFIKEYSDTQGYIRIADKLTYGNMSRAYEVLSLILGLKQFQKLRWKHFEGTTEKWHFIRKQLFDTNNNLKEEFIGTDGHVTFSDLYTNGQMTKAFKTAVNILGSRKEVEQQLKWKEYFGNSTKQLKVQQNIFKDKQSINQFITKHKGIKGYIAYTNKYYEGSLRTARQSVQYFLNKEEIKLLQWKRFSGSTKQLQLLIKDFNKNYPKKWQGINNQDRIANEIFNGYLYKAYRSVIGSRDYLFGFDVNSLSKFKELNWKVYTATSRK